jgi:uncharacterized protein
MRTTLLLRGALVALGASACGGGSDGGGAGPPPPPCVPGPRSTTAIDLDTGSGVLAGTLELPAACAPFPLALIHAGSGPTNRDGNTTGFPGRNDSLRQLAEALAARGIASVRYDKRGIAASAAAGPAREEDFRFGTFADDAAAWATRLGSDGRFHRPVLVGHSEGSLVGLVAAQAPASAIAALVSVAGAGRRAGDVLREQLARQLTGELLARAHAILAELEAGRTVADVPRSLHALFRPSVQPYLIDWLPRDPAQAMAALGPRPALVVQGTTDVQVSVEDAERLAAARPDAQLVLVEGMNHVLKAASLDPAEQNRAYSDPALPIVERAVEAIATFITATAPGN